MNRRTAWRLVAIILTAAGGVLGGMARGAQDRIRTAQPAPAQRAADDSARNGGAVAYLSFAAPEVLEVGRAVELAARDGTGQRYAATWASSDTTVLRVDGRGRVEAVGPGAATVAAEVRDGRVVEVRVVVPP